MGHLLYYFEYQWLEALKTVIDLDSTIDYMKESLEDGSINQEVFDAFNDIREDAELERIEPY